MADLNSQQHVAMASSNTQHAAISNTYKLSRKFSLISGTDLLYKLGQQNPNGDY